MYQNIIYLFFFVFLTNSNSFFVKNSLHTKKYVLRLSEQNHQNQEEQPVQKSKLHRFGLYPRLDPPNDKGQLTWYPIGFAKDFGRKPKRVTIKDVNYIVWRDKKEYFGLRDSCSHQGSSFMRGEVCKNTITCPYHGYVFNGENGELVEIPEMKCIESSVKFYNET